MAQSGAWNLLGFPCAARKPQNAVSTPGEKGENALSPPMPVRSICRIGPIRPIYRGFDPPDRE